MATTTAEAVTRSPLRSVTTPGIYACTATLQVPGHRALLEGYDERRIRALVAGNWIRTVMWSTRGALGLAMVVVAIPA